MGENNELYNSQRETSYTKLEKFTTLFLCIAEIFNTYLMKELATEAIADYKHYLVTRNDYLGLRDWLIKYEDLEMDLSFFHSSYKLWEEEPYGKIIKLDRYSIYLYTEDFKDIVLFRAIFDKEYIPMARKNRCIPIGEEPLPENRKEYYQNMGSLKYHVKKNEEKNQANSTF